MNKLNIGERVSLKGYTRIVEVEGIDEMLTSMSGKTHYLGVDVDYLDNKCKTNNCEPFTFKDVEKLINTTTMNLKLEESGDANIFRVIDTDKDNWLMVIQVNGELTDAAQKELLTEMIKNHQTKD